MPGCAVAVCRNNSRWKKKGIIYHKFPNDKDMQKKWAEKCNRADPFNIDNAFVCSEHFLLEDYQRDLQNELLNLPPRKRLRQDAVPSIKLHHVDVKNVKSQKPTLAEETATNDDTYEKPKISQREMRQKSREIRKRALQRLKNLSPNVTKIDRFTETEDYFTSDERIAYQQKVLSLQKELNVLKQKHITLKLCYKKVLEQKATIHRNLANVLTKSQMCYLLKGKKKTKWTKEDIAKAITIRTISKKAYLLIRKTGFPLPGLTTLRRSAKSLVSDKE